VTRAYASPDRLDALIYAVTELLAPPRAEPRIRRLGRDRPNFVPYWAKPLYE